MYTHTDQHPETQWKHTGRQILRVISSDPNTWCPEIQLMEAAGIARRERAAAGHPARLCGVREATVASGPEPAKPNGSAPGTPNQPRL